MIKATEAEKSEGTAIWETLFAARPCGSVLVQAILTITSKARVNASSVKSSVFPVIRLDGMAREYSGEVASGAIRIFADTWPVVSMRC